MSDRPASAPRQLSTLAALGDVGFGGYAGRRLIAVYYTVSLVLTVLAALAFLLLGILAVIDGSSLGWLAVILGPLACLAGLVLTRLWLELAAARFDTRADVAAIRRHLESPPPTGAPVGRPHAGDADR